MSDGAPKPFDPADWIRRVDAAGFEAKAAIKLENIINFWGDDTTREARALKDEIRGQPQLIAAVYAELVRLRKTDP